MSAYIPEDPSRPPVDPNKGPVATIEPWLMPGGTGQPPAGTGAKDPNMLYAMGTAGATPTPGAATYTNPPVPAAGTPNPNMAGTYTPNPQLPQHPASVPAANLDSQYNAEQANLAFEINQRYNDVLKNLGYMDPSTGQFIMGRVETEANRQRAELNRNYDLATEQATQARQLEGTLFSGRRATEEARAQHPFVQGVADLDVQTPQQLADLYEQAGNLMTEYVNRQNMLLVSAAQRRAAAALASGAGGDGTNPKGPQPPPPTVTHGTFPGSQGTNYPTIPTGNADELGYSPNPFVDPRLMGHPVGT